MGVIFPLSLYLAKRSGCHHFFFSFYFFFSFIFLPFFSSFLFFSFLLFPIDATFALPFCLSLASEHYICIPLPCSRALLFPGGELQNMSDILVFMLGDPLSVASIQETAMIAWLWRSGGRGLCYRVPWGYNNQRQFLANYHSQDTTQID